jgi:hypothetical protein
MNFNLFAVIALDLAEDLSVVHPPVVVVAVHSVHRGTLGYGNGRKFVCFADFFDDS